MAASQIRRLTIELEGGRFIEMDRVFQQVRFYGGGDETLTLTINEFIEGARLEARRRKITHPLLEGETKWA